MKRKLLLFDVDGTLILTGGLAAGLMAEAVSRVIGSPIQWNITDFVGNTDRSIIQTLLRRNGAIEPMLADMTENVLEMYLQNLKIKLKDNSVVQILPGVKPLLRALKKDDRFALALLTGNVEAGARIKLAKNKIIDYFPVGAFGNDALKREYLPPFAIQRAEKHFNCFFDKKDIWIIGDSANDIKCAQANHLRSFAVATGHTKMAELESYHPTALIADLKDQKKFLDVILASN
jgi:phosphoglycolate phosphatase